MPRRSENQRNKNWMHLFSRDIISMPDKWEYPWFAAWDLAFHMVPFSRIDPHFSKEQILLFLREWYMHPNGQMPAYEFAFDDVNPPVHAWSAWRVYRAEGSIDKEFLGRVFQKLLMNFTWWVNRKDKDGQNLFSGGFLGMDNVGVFDRSHPMPGVSSVHQADGTAWMAFYCSTMLKIALELAPDNKAYEDLASKFFEHFIQICDAMNSFEGTGLWDEEDGFYYDSIVIDGKAKPMKIRSMVGLIPLIASVIIEDSTIENLPGFRKRLEWFLKSRRDLARHVSYMDKPTATGQPEGYQLLAVPSRQRLKRVLEYMIDEDEFLSPHGLRSLSKFHEDNPYKFEFKKKKIGEVAYVPGASNTHMFGGNSNWRGPVWFPVNYIVIESLYRFHHFYGETFKVEFPKGSGKKVNLKDLADALHRRLTKLFVAGEDGKRPNNGSNMRYADDPNWKDLILFYEFFNGDNGRGLGASHQTGWTALISTCFDRLGGFEG